jgi:hypothetical protein
VITRHLIAWCAIALAAVANGAARDLVYKPFLGELAAHQLSTLLLMAVIGAAAWFLQARWPLDSARDALLVGALWTLMTLAFECLLGRLAGHSWEEIASDYDVAAGRVWVAIPFTLLVSPVLARLVRMSRPRGAR